ncbi:MAG: hydantoinase/oxoprolinase family protein [Rhodospirillales bacterium]|nr:hydantoinase/oxoprolinase family protein [Rhodospirillales bacterium]MDP7650846.1 hydantoinase/oxoprolinase family protein [Rhodospirillales bacterium]
MTSKSKPRRSPRSRRRRAGYRIGVDIGGTFTDIILLGPGGELATKKILSTPDDYSRAVVEGMMLLCDENGIGPSRVEQVIHGTTVVTNTVIELAGAKVGLITTKGFRDVLEIARGRNPDLFNLAWQKPPPLVPRRLRLEVDERINGKGEIVRPLDEKGTKDAVRRLLDEGVEAIAVCLINSPVNTVHEKRIAEIIRKQAPDIHMSVSHQVMPMIMEYERTSETVLNAYVMPLATRYLLRLESRIRDVGFEAPLYIMQSNGGMIMPETAAQRPVEIMECGPAAGVVGAAYLARRQGISNMITYDMGGTTAKASMVEGGRFSRSAEYEVGGGINQTSGLMKGYGYVVRVPSIDIAEMGAGGGSLLRIDVGGALHVGPESAGADPGPVCYDRGGTLPTLTDADIVLGYINPEHLCGGDMPLDAEKAFAAIRDRIAEPLGKDPYEAAYGAYLLANANMMRAIRAVSSERGRDPRKFGLYAFGGAGPVHATGVAAGLGIRTVVIPPEPGVYSAFGLLTANIERHYTRSFPHLWDDDVLDPLNRLFGEMTEEAQSTVATWGGRPSAKPGIERMADMEYAGQTTRLSIPVPNRRIGKKSLAALARAFEEEHLTTYGHKFQNHAIRVAALRLTAVVLSPKPSQTKVATKPRPARAAAGRMRRAYWGQEHGFVETPVRRLDDLGSKPVRGPLLVDGYDATIVVPPGSTIAKGEWGNAVITIGEGEATHGR